MLDQVIHNLVAALILGEEPEARQHIARLVQTPAHCRQTAVMVFEARALERAIGFARVFVGLTFARAA